MFSRKNPPNKTRIKMKIMKSTFMIFFPSDVCWSKPGLNITFQQLPVLNTVWRGMQPQGINLQSSQPNQKPAMCLSFQIFQWSSLLIMTRFIICQLRTSFSCWFFSINSHYRSITAENKQCESDLSLKTGSLDYITLSLWVNQFLQLWIWWMVGLNWHILPFY